MFSMFNGLKWNCNLSSFEGQSIQEVYIIWRKNFEKPHAYLLVSALYTVSKYLVLILI